MSKWEKVIIEEVCEILDSMRIPVTASDRKSGLYPYYGANGVQGYVSEYIIDDELVLLAEDGGNFGSKTRPIAYRVSGKCWVNNHAHVLKAKPTIDVDYLCYSIMFYDVSKIISGTTRAKLNQAAMRKMTIPLPPLETQKQIAKTLDTASELLAMHKQQLAELDNLIKSTFYDMFGDPVTNEMGWEMKCVDEIADTRLGKMRDKQFITGNHLKYYLGNSNVRWFSFSFDKMEQMDFDNNEQLKYSLQYGDLLVCEGGEIGRCAIWKCEIKDVYFQKALHRIRVKKDTVNQYYLAYVFYLFSLGHGFENVTNRATIAHLTGVKLKKILIPTPPVTLQTRFAEIVTKIEEQKALAKKAIDETQYLFDSLMSEYFA